MVWLAGSRSQKMLPETRFSALVAPNCRRAGQPNGGSKGAHIAFSSRVAHLYASIPTSPMRSEEHTSELQSLMRISYAVFCLKNKNNQQHITNMTLTHLQQ